MFSYAVYVIDRVDRSVCCVGDLLTRAEAGEIKRCLERFNACDVQIVTSTFIQQRGDQQRGGGFDGPFV